jgi:hypothetical protein
MRRTFLAIERLRQNAGNRSFTHPPLTSKKKGMGNPIAFYGVLQGLDHVFLTDYFFKHLRPPLTSDNQVRHTTSSTTQEI